MDKKSPLIFISLALLSLVVMTFMLFRDISKFKPVKKNTGTGGLFGMVAGIEMVPTKTADMIRQYVENTLQSTKETLTQKSQEVQKSIRDNAEKELKTFTKNQIDAVKMEICKDWGVISSISPTPIPTP